MSLYRPVLSAGPIDRRSERRTEPDLLERLLALEATRVVLLRDGQAPVRRPPQAPHKAELDLLGGPDALAAAGAGTTAVFLGEDPAGVAYVALAVTDPADDRTWGGLREVAGLLDEQGAALLTSANAVLRWHENHPRCAGCGALTDVASAGWTRLCPSCGREHYPRVDPAVIMAVVDEAGRLLLGRQAVWPAHRFSTLAGFVEPGETLEDAVRREVREEVGVSVDRVEYRGSQPWPLPSSLMLGFRAVAATTDIDVDGTEIAEARWFTREQFVADLASGGLMLPGSISIARSLIEDWFGATIPGEADWR